MEGNGNSVLEVAVHRGMMAGRTPNIDQLEYQTS